MKKLLVVLLVLGCANSLILAMEEEPMKKELTFVEKVKLSQYPKITIKIEQLKKDIDKNITRYGSVAKAKRGLTSEEAIINLSEMIGQQARLTFLERASAKPKTAQAMLQSIKDSIEAGTLPENLKSSLEEIRDALDEMAAEPN